MTNTTDTQYEFAILRLLKWGAYCPLNNTCHRMNPTCESKCPNGGPFSDQDDINRFVAHINTATKPVKNETPRYGMGYEYHDWLCPMCGKFLAWEPNPAGIPARCPRCGQLLESVKE